MTSAFAALIAQSAAKATGMKMAAYMRHQAIYGKIEIHNHIVANFSSLEKIAAELSSISNNLNQLTKYFHMGGVKSEAMQEELRRCINEVMPYFLATFSKDLILLSVTSILVSSLPSSIILFRLFFPGR